MCHGNVILLSITARTSHHFPFLTGLLDAPPEKLQEEAPAKENTGNKLLSELQEYDVSPIAERNE